MRKLLFKLIAVVSLVAVAFGTLAGCALFEVNKDRDMAQVAVSVDISEGGENGVKSDIYKRDIVAGYLSYGYYYVQKYGYTTAKAYQLVLDNLVNNAVIIQQSKKELAGDLKESVYKDGVKVLTADDIVALNDGKGEAFLSLIASDNDIAGAKKNVGDVGYIKELETAVKNAYKGDLKRTDANEVLKAVSDGIDNLNSFIDSFAEDDDDDEHDHEKLTYTARTTPTMDAEEEKIDVEACLKKINDDKTGLNAKIEGDRLKAFKKGYNRLQDLGLLETDATDEKFYEEDGVPTVFLGVPCRYLNSPAVVADEADIENMEAIALELIGTGAEDEEENHD